MRTLTEDQVIAVTQFGKDMAALWVRDRGELFPTVLTGPDGVPVPVLDEDGKQVVHTKMDRPWIMKQLYNLAFKDEFEIAIASARLQLGPLPLADFETALTLLEPRTDEVFLLELEKRKPVGYVPLVERTTEKEA